MYAHRWSIIASHLPGRTDNDVKNHWNTKLKKKLIMPLMAEETPSNDNKNNNSATIFDKFHDPTTTKTTLFSSNHYYYYSQTDQISPSSRIMPFLGHDENSISNISTAAASTGSDINGDCGFPPVDIAGTGNYPDIDMMAAGLIDQEPMTFLEGVLPPSSSSHANLSFGFF